MNQTAKKYKCPACKEISPISHWDEIDIVCDSDICPCHVAIICPKCKTCFDLAFNNERTWEVKE